MARTKHQVLEEKRLAAENKDQQQDTWEVVSILQRRKVDNQDAYKLKVQWKNWKDEKKDVDWTWEPEADLAHLEIVKSYIAGDEWVAPDSDSDSDFLLGDDNGRQETTEKTKKRKKKNITIQPTKKQVRSGGTTKKTNEPKRTKKTKKPKKTTNKQSKAIVKKPATTAKPVTAAKSCNDIRNDVHNLNFKNSWQTGGNK